MTEDHQRPTWDDYFMNIAREVAQRSTCTRAQVGAVIVKEKRILTTGYNGSPRGLPHCSEVGCLMENDHCVRTLHAEQNAIIQAAVFGVSITDSTLYCTSTPCVVCVKMLINAGVKEIIYSGDYPDDLAKKMLRESNLKIKRFK